MSQDNYRCVDCDWHGPEHEIYKEEFFKETRLEPSEWVWHCPICFKTDSLEKDTTVYCKSCGDVPVSDEGEMCGECFTCWGEDMADSLADR